MTVRKRPTDRQIQAEVQKLINMKPSLPATTAFGDDNRAAVDAQIQVLEEQMDEDAIYNRYGPVKDEDTDEETFDGAEGSQHELDHALDASRWLQGEDKEAPSVSWKPLSKPKRR